MEDWREEIYERTNLFAAENGRSLIGQLGYGYDGNVFATGAEKGQSLSLVLPAELQQELVAHPGRYASRRRKLVIPIRQRCEAFLSQGLLRFGPKAYPFR